MPKWISAALALVAFLAGHKGFLAEVTGVLSGIDFFLAGCCWIWESGSWEHSKICSSNYLLNLLRALCKVTQQTLHKNRKRPLCTVTWGWVRQERALAMTISNQGISQLFQVSRPIIQPHPLYSRKCPHFKDNSTQMCICTALHPSSSTGWLCKRLGFTTDPLNWGPSLPWSLVCHLHIVRQCNVPEGGKWSCWLLSAHPEEGKVSKIMQKLMWFQS